MKKINLFIAPIIAISLLASCSCANNPQPEPTVTTYTVVLNASDGSSFSGGQKTLFLDNIPEGTPLNESVGYALPTTPDHLDFNYWYDEHGNVVAANAPVNSNLYLTSKFYHGPEFERNYVYNTIYDELWNDINNPNWRRVFSSDQVQSFADVTYQALFNEKLATIGAIDSFKKLYDFAKYEMFINRDDTEIVELIFKCYQDTIKDIFSLITNKSKAELFVNLSYAYFVVKCFQATDSDHEVDTCQYAYQSLLNLINEEIPNDDINCIRAWNPFVINLLITSYYIINNQGIFDSLLALAKIDIGNLLKNEICTSHDIEELARIYADYYLARYRSIDDEPTSIVLSNFVKYIDDNFFEKDIFKALIVNLYKYYLSACASEQSFNVNCSHVITIEATFEEMINNSWSSYPTHARRYYTIAALFAEAARRNPSEIEYIYKIPSTFSTIITSEVESWTNPQTPYLYYIDSFAAIAEALSQFDHFIMLENGTKPSYMIYEQNIGIILEIISKIIQSGKVTEGKTFASIPVLAKHIAKISNYTKEAYKPTSSVACRWITNGILNPGSPLDSDGSLWIATLLPIELDDAVIKCVGSGEATTDLDENKVKNMFGYYQCHHIKDDKFLPLLPVYENLFSKAFLNVLCSDEISGYDLFALLVSDFKEFDASFGSTTNGILYRYIGFKIIIETLNQKALYRGSTMQYVFDPSRASSVLIFLLNQIRNFANDKIINNFDAAYDCIIKVLLDDFIPKITDVITGDELHTLENEIYEKIQTLIENY
ncbi:MAG: hypothetical protein MJ214_05115 [Bacilli bacterium]|nr:hypothetical protein [Bacilli bacterium]